MSYFQLLNHCERDSQCSLLPWIITDLMGFRLKFCILATIKRVLYNTVTSFNNQSIVYQWMISHLNQYSCFQWACNTISMWIIKFFEKKIISCFKLLATQLFVAEITIYISFNVFSVRAHRTLTCRKRRQTAYPCDNETMNYSIKKNWNNQNDIRSER